MRRSKDCPECRLTAHKGRCAFCAGSGSIPLAPPVGATVLCDMLRRDSGDGELMLQELPLTVMRSRRFANEEGYAVVEVSGWLLVRPPKGGYSPWEWHAEILGPSHKEGHWHWQGEPS